VPNGLGAIKYRSFKPIYFNSNSCTGVPQQMPRELTTLSVERSGNLWVLPNCASVPVGVGYGWLRYNYDSIGSFSLNIK